jgi:hypothetical protein
MPQRRTNRIVAWSLVGLIFLAALTVFAVAKRPITTPRYPAAAWEGTGGAHSGWLDVDTKESSVCFYVANGPEYDPTARVGLVLPDSYRGFKLSIVERGRTSPAPFISGPSLWAGAKIAQYGHDVILKGRPAVGDGWLADARAEWNKYCDPSVETVIVVQPGTLATPGG